MKGVLLPNYLRKTDCISLGVIQGTTILFFMNQSIRGSIDCQKKFS